MAENTQVSGNIKKDIREQAAAGQQAAGQGAVGVGGSTSVTHQLPGGGGSGTEAKKNAKEGAKSSLAARLAAEEEAKRRAAEEAERAAAAQRAADEAAKRQAEAQRKAAEEAKRSKAAPTTSPVTTRTDDGTSSAVSDYIAAVRGLSADDVSRINGENVANGEQPMLDTDRAPAGTMDSTGFVDTETGEVSNTSPNQVTEAAPPALPAMSGSDALRRVGSVYDAMASGGLSNLATPEWMATTPATGAIPAPAQMSADQVEAAASAQVAQGDQETPDLARRQSEEQEKARRAEAKKRKEEDDLIAKIDEISLDSIMNWTKIPKKMKKRDVPAYLLKQLDKTVEPKYRILTERIRRANGLPADSVGFDQQKENPDFDDWTLDNAGRLEEAYESAREEMLRRQLNPWHLKVEGEHVEFMTDKHGNRYARVVFGEDDHKEIEHAIGTIARKYDCGFSAVMALVSDRASVGVDSKGKIVNVDPDKFKMSKRVFLEICNDILVSQEKYGHPFGIVDGTPGNGVRDGSGRFVVLGGTRCFPIGYMSNDLIRQLSVGAHSPLHELSPKQIQERVAREWLTHTYPAILSNMSGNAAYQARAIENMMRGKMQADGHDPNDLSIPEIAINRSLMQVEAELVAAGDKDIAMATEARAKKMRNDNFLYRMKYRKQSGAKDKQGNWVSGPRKRNSLGDTTRGISRWEMFCKSSNFLLWATSPVEALQSLVDQNMATFCSDLALKVGNPEIAERYKMTDALNSLSRSDEAAEAYAVATSLERLGGMMAINSMLDTSAGTNYHLTYADLTRFLKDVGYSPETGVTDRLRQVFGIKPGEENAFMVNAQAVMNGIENVLLGTSGLAQKVDSNQFVRLSLGEMARTAARNERDAARSNSARMTFSTSDLENVGNGEALVRNLLMTDQGHEAFLTNGVASLGRKSPLGHAVRLVMAKNGATEFAIRSMFDRFPEYGVNKILRQVPCSNTISYILTFGVSRTGGGISRAGEAISSATATGSIPNRVGETMRGVGEALGRSWEYQMGSTYYRGDYERRSDRLMSFMVGLRKNLLYDSIMAGDKLVTAAIMKFIIMAMGGLEPPEEEENRYTPSEWVIGDGEDAVPIKFAWFMDDLMGVSAPLAIAWQIAEQGDYSSEAVTTAARVFINGVASFNDGTVVLDAIDLVREFDGDPFGYGDIQEYGIDYNTWWRTQLEVQACRFFGNMTPTVIEQMLPWSRDYIFMGYQDAHTASYVYDVGEGSNYDTYEAQTGYHTRYLDKYAGDYEESMVRHESQNHALVALLMDIFSEHADNEASTSYRYGLMPISTMTDPKDRSGYDRFSISMDDLPVDQSERARFLERKAAATVSYVTSNYENATQAANDGFVLNGYARMNCLLYCDSQIDLINDEIDAAVRRYKIEHGVSWVPNDEYDRITEDLVAQRDEYKRLKNEFFSAKSDVPYRLPRYVEYETERETRYVHEDGSPATYIDYVMGNAEREEYAYGNIPTVAPIYSPVTEGKAFNYETPAYWVHLDEDGNILNDTGAIYDRLGNMTVETGRRTGSDTRELMYGGQGNNLRDDVSEELAIGREGVATIAERNWREEDSLMPEALQNIEDDPAAMRELLGLPALDEGGDKASSTSSNDDDIPYYGTPYYGGGGYYGYGGGGGGYYYRSYGGGGSSYTPRIYSTTHSVYPSRASGMGVRTPYKPATTYLRPSYSTKGSREAYRRNDL